MSNESPRNWPFEEEVFAEQRTAPFPTPRPDYDGDLRRAVAAVMNIEDITPPTREQPLRFRGRLLVPAEQAFATLRPQFEAAGYTPQLRREDGLEVIRALPGVYRGRERSIPWLNIGLLIATILSVFYIGVQQELYVSVIDVIAVQVFGVPATGPAAELMPTPAELREALLTGALYTLALLGILGAHEMGHYIMARRHNVDVTLPFFIPLPINILGTMGAVIAMREPAPNRRIQFDIGIAGPLAGLIVAVPVMLIGLSLSEVGTREMFLEQVPEPIRDNTIFFQEGQSLAYMALKYLVFGQVLPSGDLDVWVHPVAFAAWAGFLVTMLNLIPVGQLDGGHVVYGLFGHRAQMLRWPIIGVLAVLALAGALNDAGIANLPFGWSGWWLWILLILFLARRHAPVLDEITELDAPRKALGVAMLVIFVLIFTPQPIVIDPGPTAALLQTLV